MTLLRSHLTGFCLVREDNKSPVQRHGAFVDHCVSKQELNLVDFRGLGAFLALTDFERYTIALGKGFETVTLNFREVNKDVRTIVLLNESEPFGVVKPFDCTFCHCLAPFRPPLGPVEIVVQTLLLVTTNKNTHKLNVCVFCSLLTRCQLLNKKGYTNLLANITRPSLPMQLFF
jgi:hypothetical protein